MLKDAVFQKQSGDMALILSMLGQGGDPVRIREGIYMSPSFSMGNSILNLKGSQYDNIDLTYELGNYGVCDTVAQVLERYDSILSDPDRAFCLSFTIVCRDEQESRGGWRWEKWGEYIGTREPKASYLYDEPEIEQVLIYHIYELDPNKYKININ